MYGIASDAKRAPWSAAAWSAAAWSAAGWWPAGTSDDFCGGGAALIVVMRPPCGNAPGGWARKRMRAGPPGTARARGQLAPLATVEDRSGLLREQDSALYVLMFAQRTASAHRVNPELGEVKS